MKETNKELIYWLNSWYEYVLIVEINELIGWLVLTVKFNETIHETIEEPLMKALRNH